jgi:hypothetical protein
MDAPQRTRRMNRDRSDRPVQARRGTKQMVIPMTREQYDECWHDPARSRAFLDRTRAEHPELFPPCLRDGYGQRTSNTVDRPMNRLHRWLYAGRGLHGHPSSSERRLCGWALLQNFRPFARRSGQVREHQSPAHRLNGKRYHPRWLQNLLVSASLMGYHQTAPAIR